MIVRLAPDAPVESLIEAQGLLPLQFEPIRELVPMLNIWLVGFAEDAGRAAGIEADQALSMVRSQPAVQVAQFNHVVELREALAEMPLPIEAPRVAPMPRSPFGGDPSPVFPNDPRFNEMWGLWNTGQSGGTPGADTKAPLAWSMTTGEGSSHGDDIVVAIVDSGFDLNHGDLPYWKNENESPTPNGQDNDGNGYVDDYHGWNAYNNNGSITSSQHGTHVAGTSAARGNNNLGVAGVNWGAKIMPIQGSSGNEAIVVAAYGYALTMRTLYNQTGGEQGAFVVATNASFGVDYGNPNNFPIWCGMYDEMGAAGILSMGATANAGINIDQMGDVPTACPSDWLIAVTNTTRTDQRNAGAGYGLTTIDLGAPGTQILSTVPGGGYTALTGTSMATPHVTGAVALLVSAMSPSRLDQYKADPAAVALEIKQAILDGTEDIGLQTVTGGRLDLYGALMEAMFYDVGGEVLSDDAVFTDEVLEGVALFIPAGVTLTVEGTLTLRADADGTPAQIFVAGTIQGEADLILEDGSEIIMRPGGRYLLFPPMPSDAGQAASFSGDTRLDIAPSSAIPDDELTLSAWFKADAPEGTLFEIANEDHLALRLELVADGDAGFFRYSHEAADGSLVSQDFPQVAVEPGVRHQVTLTRGGTPAAVRLFIDGTRVGSPFLYTAEATDETYGLTVGNSYDGENGFTGIMDEVRLYNEPLSAATLRAAMHVVFDPTAIPTNLVAYYSFEESEAGTAIDYSGNGRVGVFTDGARARSTFPVGRFATLLNGLPLSAGAVGPEGARLNVASAEVGGGNSIAIYASRIEAGAIEEDDLPSGIIARSATTWGAYVLGDASGAATIDFSAIAPTEWGVSHVLFRADVTEDWEIASVWNGTGTTLAGPITTSGEFAIGYGGFVPTEDEARASGVPTLAPAFPNPVQGQATLMLDLPESASVTVEVLDVLGRRVSVLHDGVLPASANRLTLDASSLAPGLYLVRATGEGFSQTQRVTVVR